MIAESAESDYISNVGNLEFLPSTDIGTLYAVGTLDVGNRDSLVTTRNSRKALTLLHRVIPVFLRRRRLLCLGGSLYRLHLRSRCSRYLLYR